MSGAMSITGGFFAVIAVSAAFCLLASFQNTRLFFKSRIRKV
jgi:hypothetical protein